jgi:hypothetical protein
MSSGDYIIIIKRKAYAMATLLLTALTEASIILLVIFFLGYLLDRLART